MGFDLALESLVVRKLAGELGCVRDLVPVQIVASALRDLFQDHTLVFEVVQELGNIFVVSFDQLLRDTGVARQKVSVGWEAAEGEQANAL